MDTEYKCGYIQNVTNRENLVFILSLQKLFNIHATIPHQINKDEEMS